MSPGWVAYSLMIAVLTLASSAISVLSKTSLRGAQNGMFWLSLSAAVTRQLHKHTRVVTTMPAPLGAGIVERPELRGGTAIVELLSYRRAGILVALLCSLGWTGVEDDERHANCNRREHRN